MKITKTIEITISDADKSKCDRYCEFYNYRNILTKCSLFKNTSGNNEYIAFDARCPQCIEGVWNGE